MSGRRAGVRQRGGALATKIRKVAALPAAPAPPQRQGTYAETSVSAGQGQGTGENTRKKDMTHCRADTLLQKAIEHVDQARFTHLKEMDKLRCIKRQRVRALLSIEVRRHTRPFTRVVNISLKGTTTSVNKAGGDSLWERGGGGGYATTLVWAFGRGRS